MPRSRLPVSTITHDYWVARNGSVFDKSYGVTDPSSMVLRLVVLRLKQAQDIRLTEEDGKLTIELPTIHGTHCYVLSNINDDADHLIWLMVLCLVYAQAITGGEASQGPGKRALDYLLESNAQFELPSLRTKRPMQVAHWALCLALGIDPLELTTISVDDILEAVVRINKKRPLLEELLADRGCVR